MLLSIKNSLFTKRVFLTKCRDLKQQSLERLLSLMIINRKGSTPDSNKYYIAIFCRLNEPFIPFVIPQKLF